MRSLTCIVCPIGCALSVEEGPPGPDGITGLTVSGNRCKRGAVYAQEEIRAPKRTVTATCGIDETVLNAGAPGGLSRRSEYAPRRVPVKTTSPCPKERIDELLGDIYRLRIGLPVKAGDVVIPDWRNTGIRVIAVRNMD
jgi:CxxC motif-containing protein